MRSLARRWPPWLLLAALGWLAASPSRASFAAFCACVAAASFTTAWRCHREQQARQEQQAWIEAARVFRFTGSRHTCGPDRERLDSLSDEERAAFDALAASVDEMRSEGRKP